MRLRTPALTSLLLVAFSLSLLAEGPNDSLQRERKKDAPEKNAAKDALEGKAPPKLDVGGWLNTPDGKALTWADLRGKVVLIDFWRTW